jgi:hypothetical protein
MIGTSQCKAVAASVGNTDLVIVDCPGFDDTVRSDTEILREITEMLSALYIVGLKLKGVIYLHRITDNRMQGSAMKNLQLFMKLVGESALSNVVFVTTMWGKLQKDDEGEANDHDSELREEYWADFLRLGASATRFDGSQASAEGILSQLLGKKEVVLKVQHELVDERMPLNQTTAGAFLEPVVHRQEAEFEARVQELKEQLKFEKDSSKRLDVTRSKRKAEAGKAQREKDLKTLQSKPAEEMEAKLSRLRAGSLDVWKNALQALAAVVSISIGIAGFVTGVAGGF